MLRLGSSGVAVVAGLAVVGLGLLGAALTPSWRAPRPIHDTPPRSTAKPGLVARRTAALPIDHEHTRIRAQDTVLDARVAKPAADGQYPGVVLVPGSGPHSRSDLADEADALAGRGVVALTYDKRRSGYSPLQRDYGLLAEDALAGVRLLREQPGVDPHIVGLWGISEGGWVLPIAATRSPVAVDFLIQVSAPNMSPLRQLAWTVDARLRDLRAPFGLRALAARALGEGRGTLGYATYDPRPVLCQVDQPVLAVYGTRDETVPTAESARRLIAALRTGGNDAYTVRYFPGAGHGLRLANGAFPAGYAETMATWVQGLPVTARPAHGGHIVGPASGQRYATFDVPRAAWFAAGVPRLIGTALVAIGYLAVLIAYRRRAGSSDRQVPRILHHRLRRVVAGGFVVHLAPFAVLGVAAASLSGHGSSLALNAVWAVARLVAVADVVVAVHAADGAVAALRGGWRPTVAQQITLGGAGVSTCVTLLFAAYAGLYAFNW